MEEYIKALSGVMYQDWINIGLIQKKNKWKMHVIREQGIQKKTQERLVKTMMELEVRKEQEIKNMVEILKQIDLPDILLLTRDANTLLMRQKESERRAG